MATPSAQPTTRNPSVQSYAAGASLLNSSRLGLSTSFSHQNTTAHKASQPVPTHDMNASSNKLGKFASPAPSSFVTLRSSALKQQNTNYKHLHTRHDTEELTREADTACAELFGEEEEEEDGNEEFSDAPDFFAPSDLLQHNNPASPVSQTSFTPSVPVAPAPTSSLVRFAQQQAAARQHALQSLQSQYSSPSVNSPTVQTPKAASQSQFKTSPPSVKYASPTQVTPDKDNSLLPATVYPVTPLTTVHPSTSINTPSTSFSNHNSSAVLSTATARLAALTSRISASPQLLSVKPNRTSPARSNTIDESHQNSTMYSQSAPSEAYVSSSQQVQSHQQHVQYAETTAVLLNSELYRLQNELNQTRAELIRVAHERDSSLVDRDSLARQLSALSMSHQHDITNQNAAHARLSADLKEAESRADALQLELFKRQNELETELKNAQHNAAVQNEKFELYQQELSRLQQQLSTVQQQLSSAQEREHAVVQQYSTLQHEVQQMQEARRHDEHQFNELNREVQSERTRCMTLETTLAQLRSQNNELSVEQQQHHEHLEQSRQILLSERAHALQAIRETIKTALAPRLATLSAELSSEIGEQLCESLPEDIADQLGEELSSALSSHISSFVPQLFRDCSADLELIVGEMTKQACTEALKGPVEALTPLPEALSKFLAQLTVDRSSLVDSVCDLIGDKLNQLNDENSQPLKQLESITQHLKTTANALADDAASHWQHQHQVSTCHVSASSQQLIVDEVRQAIGTALEDTWNEWGTQLHSLLSELLIQQQQQNQLHLQQSVEVLQAEHERTRNVISDSMAAVVHDTSVSLAEALGETISANSNQHSETLIANHRNTSAELLSVFDSRVSTHCQEGASKAIDVWMSNHAEASAAAVATATLQFMQDQSSAVQGALFSWWTLSQWRDAARALNSACSLDRVESLSTSSIENHDSDEDHVEFTQSSRVESNIIQTAFVQSLSSTMTHIADMDQRIQSMSSVLTKLDAQHGESDWSEVLASFAQRCGLADFLPTELSVSSLARSTNEMTPLEQWAKLLQHIGRSTADLHAAAATMTAHSQHRQQLALQNKKLKKVNSRQSKLVQNENAAPVVAEMHWSHHLSTCYRSTILLTLFSVFVLIIAYITRDVPPYRPSI